MFKESQLRTTEYSKRKTRLRKLKQDKDTKEFVIALGELAVIQLVIVVLIYVFAHFTFMSSDPENCWIGEGDDVPYANKESAGDGATNYSEVFRRWLRYGFCIYFILFGTMILKIVSCIIDHQKPEKHPKLSVFNTHIKSL